MARGDDVLEAPHSVDDVWARALRLFPTWRHLVPAPISFWGLSRWATPDRMARLVDTDRARALDKLLESLAVEDVKRLAVRADVNSDLAKGALKTGVIVNISGPLGAIIIMNQLAPGMIYGLYQEMDLNFRILWLASLALMFPPVIYASAGVAAARELRHLIHLNLSKRDPVDIDRLTSPSDEDQPSVPGL